MKSIKRTLALILSLCLLAALLTACGSKTTDPTATQSGDSDPSAVETPEPTPSGPLTLTVGTMQVVALAFDNLLNRNQMGQELCYDRLTYIDPYTGERVSDILESWDFVDDTTLELKIKPGVTFTNGETLSGRDIVVTYQQCVAANQQPFSNYKNFDWDNAVISEDGLTVDVKTTALYAPGILVLDAVIDSAKQREAHPVEDTIWWSETCGTGPYKLVEQQDGASATYELRDDYWGDETYKFQTIIFKQYGDETAMMSDYQNGIIDVALQIGAFSKDELEAGAVADAVVKQFGNGNPTMLQLDESRVPAWADLNVRLAMAYAINLDDLGLAQFDGLYSIDGSFLPASVLGYEDLGGYPYDLAKAKEYLAKSNYKDGFTFDMYCDQKWSTLAETLQGQLSEIGITMNIHGLDPTVLFSTWTSGNCDAGIIPNNTDLVPEPSKVYGGMLSSAARPFSRIEDAKYNELCAQANSTTDETERVKILKEMQEYFHENCFAIPLIEETVVWTFKTTVLPESFEAYHGGFPNFRVLAE